MKTYSFLFLVMLIANHVNAQFIDNYGMRVGMGVSNQYLDYNELETLSGWKDDNYSLNFQINGEKVLHESFALKLSVGYYQYGYSETIQWVTAENDPLLPESSEFNVKLHYLSPDVVFKYIPFKGMFEPYLLLGLRTNFQVAYTGEGALGLVNEYEKVSLDAVLGVGMSYNQLLYMEFEYIPSLTKAYQSSFQTIMNRYFSLSLGVNINRLL